MTHRRGMRNLRKSANSDVYGKLVSNGTSRSQVASAEILKSSVCFFRFRYVDSAALQAQMIILPYLSENFSAEMLILLPKKEHNCKMQNWFNQVSWNAIRSEMKKMTCEFVSRVLLTDCVMDRRGLI